MEVGMGEELKRSVGPGQWAPWISDPDPPEEPMTEERMTAAAKAFMAAHPEPAPPSSNPPAKTPEQENEELLNDILRNHPNLTREEAQEQIDLFG
jgi:hypothetical protein